MSRHGCKVPPAFYQVFARDAAQFADEHAHGRLISVLEGGYSDRALISGAMAHLCGLVEGNGALPEGLKTSKEWWNIEELTKVEIFVPEPAKSSFTHDSFTA
jgi:histone deacetylase HOS3